MSNLHLWWMTNHFFSKRETKTFQCPLSEMTQTFLFYPGLKIKDAIKHFLLFYYDVTKHFIYLKCFSYITFFRRGDNAFWLFFLLIDRAVLMYVVEIFLRFFFSYDGIKSNFTCKCNKILISTLIFDLLFHTMTRAENIN